MGHRLGKSERLQFHRKPKTGSDRNEVPQLYPWRLLFALELISTVTKTFHIVSCDVY
jgi:hypothetical protein